jgi:hypothetical protein
LPSCLFSTWLSWPACMSGTRSACVPWVRGPAPCPANGSDGCSRSN